MSEVKHLMKRRRSTGKVTISDVAKLAGVGQMTVSRALRTPEVVSETLRNKIKQAIDTLGYVPNTAARELASVSSRNIVIVTSSITSTENTLILNALQQKIQHLDLQIIILLANTKNWLQELINHTPAVVILLNLTCTSSEREWIKNSSLPCIEIGARQKFPLGVNVCIDSKKSVGKMVNFLVQKGYQEIGLLCAKQELAIFQQYLDAWHKTILSKHLNPHLILDCADSISFSNGVALFKEALLMWGKIDVLMFISDELACGALFEAQRQHITIPHETAIVGLGNLEVANVSYPTLTTIDIPYERLGTIAGEQLVTLLNNIDELLSPKVILLETTLIERNSA